MFKEEHNARPAILASVNGNRLAYQTDGVVHRDTVGRDIRVGDFICYPHRNQSSSSITVKHGVVVKWSKSRIWIYSPYKTTYGKKTITKTQRMITAIRNVTIIERCALTEKQLQAKLARHSRKKSASRPIKNRWSAPKGCKPKPRKERPFHW